MLNRILVPLDGSKLAEQALAAATGLAISTGAEVVLLTAIAKQERWADADSPGWEAEEQVTATGYLDTMARDLRDNGLQATTRVAWGRPADVIRQIADEASADLIIMGTHGRSGLKRLLIGSVADTVMRTSERPLLLVRAQEEAPPQLNVKTILVPLDGSHVAESSLPFVTALAQQLSASVVLERTIVPPTVLYGEQFMPSALPVMEDLVSEARDYLETQRERVEDAGITVKTATDEGFAIETIINTADTHHADIIAITSHGRTGPARTILGSIADGLIRKSQRPCLVIPTHEPVVHDTELRAPSMLGIEPAPTVIPVGSMVEVAVADPTRVKAPAARQHRPDAIRGRKA